MDAMGFEDRSPDTLQLTRYNEGHLADYLRLLDLEADGADWREAAGLVFGIDAAAEPDRARIMHDSHLARAVDDRSRLRPSSWLQPASKGLISPSIMDQTYRGSASLR